MTRNTFFVLYFLAIFLQSGTYGLTFLLPPLFESFGANAKDVGSVLAITAFTTLLSVLYLGHITARLGRMKTISISGLLIAISLFCFGFASGIGNLVYAAGALLGIGWGLFYVLTPVVLTQVISVNERVRYFTLLSVFIMAGFGLSPVLGAQIVNYEFGIGTAFLIVGSLCLISMVIFFSLTNTVSALSLVEEQDDKNPLTLRSIELIGKTTAIRPIDMVRSFVSDCKGNGC